MAKKATISLQNGTQATYWRPHKIEVDADIDYCVVGFYGYVDQQARDSQMLPMGGERAVVVLTDEEKTAIKNFMYAVTKRYFQERDTVIVQNEEKNILEIMRGKDI